MLQNLCTGKYPVSKTLKFELRPVGMTLRYMTDKNLLDEDEHRADSSSQVKKMMDEYHKSYIDERLYTLRIPVKSEGKMNSIEEFIAENKTLEKGQDSSPELERIKMNLYKLISDHLQNTPKFVRMFKKEIIKEDLKQFVKKDDERLVIEEFKDYTTYFTGYYDTRKHFYSGEGKQSSVAYRMVDDNLKTFITNMERWNNIIRDVLNPDEVTALFKQMESYLSCADIDEMFQPEYYNQVLTQQDIDVYNAVLGGITNEDGSMTHGLNVLINLHNQQRKDKNTPKLPSLDKLKKQILSDRVVLSWLPSKFNSDAELIQAVSKFCDTLFEGPLKDLRANGQNLLNLVTNLDAFDSKRIYIGRNKSWGDISWALFGHPQTLHRLVIENEKNRVPKKKKETEMDWESRIEKILEKKKYYSIDYLNSLASTSVDSSGKTIQQDYFSDMGPFFAVMEQYTESLMLLSEPYPENRKLSQDEKSVELLRNLLNAIKDLQHYVKPLTAGLDVPDADAVFYSEFRPMWEVLSGMDHLFNMVWAYLNKKPYSNEKIKLNLRNVSLLSGWSTSKRRVACSTILRKDGQYFFAVSDSEHRGVLEEKNISAGRTNYELMDYRMLPKAAQMMPGMFLSDAGVRNNHPEPEIIEGYKKGAHLKSGNFFSVEFMRKLADYFKGCINRHPEYSTWNFQFSDTESYNDISGFYREVDRQSYRVCFVPVDEAYINRLVEEGHLYLFRIWNKDFSPYSKGRPQLHTMYFRALFEERNLTDDKVYKLNGGGEMFYRKASLKKRRPTHPAGEPLQNKNPLNPKRTSVFSYDLMKDRRYMENKFFLHIPLTMNWRADGENNVNDTVNGYIRQKDVHVIGIARGEQNLLYACVIDMQGNIVEQRSLNVINSGEGEHAKMTDYYRLVCERMQQRTEAQKNWKPVQNIKELMEGYTGQVIHLIVNWMEKYNAVAVLENPDFLGKVGKPVMDRTLLGKFERSMVEKLNYLVKKDRTMDEPGGLFRAAQLTNRFDTFDKVGNQSGVLFFVTGVAAAVTDPCTGYQNAVNFRFDKIESACTTISLLDGIYYEPENDRFRIDVDFAHFTKSLAPSRTQWSLYTWGTRFRNRKTPTGKWLTEEFGLTREMADLLVRFGIDLYGDIRTQILQKAETKTSGTREFLATFMHLLQLTAQTRHVNMETGERMFVSPVMDSNGHFYSDRQGNKNRPGCTDAVTAYNIARKGLMYVNTIRQTPAGERHKLSCPYQDWLMDMQTHTPLQK